MAQDGGCDQGRRPGSRRCLRLGLGLWLAAAMTAGATMAAAAPPTPPDERAGHPPADPKGHPVRGGFLPVERLADRITDPRRYKVRPAPPGYSWVHVGQDLFMVQDHSGLIVDTVEGGYR